MSLWRQMYTFDKYIQYNRHKLGLTACGNGCICSCYGHFPYTILDIFFCLSFFQLFLSPFPCSCLCSSLPVDSLHVVYWFLVSWWLRRLWVSRQVRPEVMLWHDLTCRRTLGGSLIDQRWTIDQQSTDSDCVYHWLFALKLGWWKRVCLHCLDY